MNFQNHQKPSCNVEQLEHRLRKLEEEVSLESGTILSELRENNRRLQELERRTAEAATASEQLHAEIVRYTERAPQQSAELPTEDIQQQLKHLSKGVELLVAAVRNVANVIAGVKRNLSHVANNTK